MLKPFEKLSFTETTVTEQFMYFCKEALTSKECGEMQDVNDNTFWMCKRHTYSIYWKINMADIDPESLQQGIYSGSEHVHGFQLSIFDVQFGKVKE